MAVLKAATRNALPDSDFAGPDRSYPIENAAHARDALSRASHNASPALDASIKRKVAAEYPGIKQKASASTLLSRPKKKEQEKPKEKATAAMLTRRSQ